MNMDWAEELKLSIRKTTARKGRRSSQQKQQTSASPTTTPEKEISLDLSVDINHDTTTTDSSDSKLPPRRISGGWADSGLKSSKNRNKHLLEDERFRQSTKSSSDSSPPDDDIPIIPDLDDVKDEIILNEIVEPPSVNVDRVVTLKELNSDLLSQNAFSAIEDVDLTILTKCLQTQESLDEADEAWEWDKLFTDVTAEIHSDKTTVEANIEIAADEITHTFT